MTSLSIVMAIRRWGKPDLHYCGAGLTSSKTIVSLFTYFAGSVASNWMDLFNNGNCKKICKVQNFHEDCR